MTYYMLNISFIIKHIWHSDWFIIIVAWMLGWAPLSCRLHAIKIFIEIDCISSSILYPTKQPSLPLINFLNDLFGVI